MVSERLASAKGVRAASESASRFGFQAALIGFLLWAAVAQTQLFVVGLISGSVLALGALGLTITYGGLRFPNLAHGMSVLLGGYVAYFFWTGQVRRSAIVVQDVVLPNFGQLPGARDRIGDLSFGYGLILAAVASAVVITVVLLAIDRLIYRRVRQRGDQSMLLMLVLSFGVAYVLISLIYTIWGVLPRPMIPGIVMAQPYPFGVLLKTDQIFVFAAAALSTVIAYVLIYRTKIGLAMRAMTDNSDLARASGIQVERVITSTWVFVGVLTAVAGTLLGLQTSLNPQFGLQLLLPLFAAALVGGIGNPIGALAGGLIVGIAQEVSVAFVAPGYKIGVSFLILVVVLLIRPNGLFGAAGFLERRE